MKKKTAAAALAFVLMLTAFTCAARVTALSAPADSYPDVKQSDWHFSAVTALSRLGIINGEPDGCFYPDAELTHGQFLKMLSCALYSYAVPECDSETMATPEGLLPLSCWSDPYRYASVSVGVLSADEGSGSAYLDSPIDRYTVALLITRVSELVLGEKSVNIARSEALLHEEIPVKYRYPVAQAYGKGYILGYEDGSFRGALTLSRAEAAQIVYRLIYPEARIDTGLDIFTPLESSELDITKPLAPYPDGGADKAVIDADWFSDAVFIGDSLTEGLRLYSGLKTPDYLCSTGATVQGILSRTPTYLGGRSILSALQSKSYAKVFVMLGINQADEGTERFRTHYSDFLDTVAAAQPGAKIYVQSILPVTRGKDAGGVFTIANVNRLNGVLKELCAQRGLVYVDIGARLCDSEGFLPDSLSWDGIHLQTTAYQKWISELMDILRETE